jgi:hypothetical protein
LHDEGQEKMAAASEMKSLRGILGAKRFGTTNPG